MVKMKTKNKRKPKILRKVRAKTLKPLPVNIYVLSEEEALVYLLRIQNGKMKR